MSQRTIHTEQTQYTYDSSLWLYKFMYAFFYGIVQNDDYAYDLKPTKKVIFLPLSSYTYDTFSVLNYDYDYFCGDMTIRTQYTYDCDSAIAQDIMPCSETGFDYFGARYYSSDLSIWLSVDAYASARPHMSPYSYTQLNPINRIDPDGNLDDWVQGADGIYWDKNATSQATTKKDETYLGKSGAIYNKNSELMVHYKSDGTKTERKPTELSGVEITGQRKSPSVKKSENINNKSAPYTSWSGVIGQVARYENTLFKNPGVPTKFIAKNGTRLGWAGEAVSIGVAGYNVYQNPTWGNYGRLGVSVGIASTNAIPYAGLGISFGLTILESGGGFNPFYDYLDDSEKLYKETGLIIIPSTRGPLVFHFNNTK